MQSSCPYLDNGQYKFSSSGLRLIHADVCTGIEAIISDTDGKGGGGSGGDTPSISPPHPHVDPNPDDGGGGGGGEGGGADHHDHQKKGTSGAFIFG